MVLEGVDEGTDCGADGDGELDETRLEGREAVVGGEGLGDAAEEEKEDAPGEADPKSKEDNDGLGHEHLGWTAERYFQHVCHVRPLDLALGVNGVACLFSELFGALC